MPIHCWNNTTYTLRSCCQALRMHLTVRVMRVARCLGIFRGDVIIDRRCCWMWIHRLSCATRRYTRKRLLPNPTTRPHPSTRHSTHCHTQTHNHTRPHPHPYPHTHRHPFMRNQGSTVSNVPAALQVANVSSIAHLIPRFLPACVLTDINTDMSENDVIAVDSGVAVQRLDLLRELARTRYRRYYNGKKHEEIVARNHAKYLRRAGAKVACECGHSVKKSLLQGSLMHDYLDSPHSSPGPALTTFASHTARMHTTRRCPIICVVIAYREEVVR